jgi:hypothetical protein
MERLLEWPAKVPLGTRRAVIVWWESRRFRFNLYVGTVGVLTCLLVLIPGSFAVKPGEDFVEPVALVFAPFVYGFLANVCYSMGWMVDAVFFRGAPRIRLYQLGVLFSVTITAIPGLWAIVAWLMTVVTGKKLD